MPSPSWIRPSPPRRWSTVTRTSSSPRCASSWARSPTSSTSRSSQAVHANNSADVLSIVGRLLDAGNGAPQLARQFVRYLRNTIVAKVTNLSPDADATGIAADLLQISPEERNRAARSAALFTEEDLSRFLAIMLRTFDELGYRQEQRFHLELGLLKLVHVQRLIPIEDLLSQLGTKPASRPNTTPTGLGTPASRPSSMGTPSATASPSPRVGQHCSATLPPASSPRPTPSAIPLRVRSLPQGSHRKPQRQPEPVRSEPTPTAGSMALAPAPVAEAPANETQAGPQLVVAPVAVASAPAVTAEPSPAADLDLESLQAALVSALAAVKGQQSASEQIEDSTLKLNGNTLEIHTTLSKTMLPVVVNADAERTLKAALREANAGSLTLKLIPGAPAAAAGPKKASRCGEWVGRRRWRKNIRWCRRRGGCFRRRLVT